MTKTNDIYLDNEPEPIDEKWIIARDFRVIPKGHCIQCKKKYDTKHTERFDALVHWDFCGSVFKVYSAKTGYCPECVANAKGKEHASSCRRYIESNRMVSKSGMYARFEDGLVLPAETTERVNYKRITG